MWSSETKRLGVMERSDGCVFLLLEYDFCLLNWTGIDFTPQIQINKQIMKNIRFAEPHPYPERNSPTVLSSSGHIRYKVRSCTNPS